MIKILALDMDGTLLNSKKEIPQAHIEAIRQAIEKGVKLVLCTGRPLVGVKPYYDKLGLAQENEYVIVDNGCATHQTSDWSLVDWQELSGQDIRYLYSLSENSPVQLTLFDEEHYFVVGEKASSYVVNDASLVFTIPTEISLEEACSGQYRMFQAMFLGSQEQVDAFEADFGQEIFALERLAKQLDVNPQEIMAIGDANNDIEMLEYAGLGVAMGNASDHVKSLADAVTDSCEENGVATAIEKFILNS